MIRIVFIFSVFVVASNLVFSQSANISVNRDYYHLLERYEMMSGKFSTEFHSHIKPLQRKHVGSFIDSLLQDDELDWWLSDRDQFNLQYLATDNWEWVEGDSSDSKKPILKIFYRKKNDLGHISKGDFDLHINPVLYFSGGKESASNVTTYINTRGLDIGVLFQRNLVSILILPQHRRYIRNILGIGLCTMV